MIPKLPDPAGSRAVLIGTSVYTDPKLPDIPGVANNLTDLTELLTSPDGTGLPPEHVTVVENPSAQAEVGDRVLESAEEAEDLLLVYYSGHGLMTWGSAGSELCLSLRDTRSRGVATSALHCSHLRQYILDSGARTRVLILDCCYSSRDIKPTLGDPAQTMLAQVDIAGAYVLTAADNEALALPGQRNTLFTGELLRMVREGVAAETGMLLSLDTLFTAVKSVMHRRNWPEPECNSHGTAAHLAIAYNKAHRVHSLLAGLRTDIERLAAEEAETNVEYAHTVDRIATPNLPPQEVAAHLLRDRLAALDRAATDGQPPSADELAELNGAVVAALNNTKRLRELAAGPLDWRNQLRAKLDGYQVEAVQREIAEDPEIARKYRAARELVWTKPCHLGAATRAVNAYQQAVIARRERRG